MMPRELDGLLEAVNERERRMFVPAAMICSVMANIHRDPEQRDEPFTIEDFLPGGDGPKSKEEEMIEWLEYLDRVERGEEEPEYDEEAMKKFRKEMQQTFKGAPAAGQQKSTTAGPRGKAESINAIAGESPRRGVR